MFHATDNHLGPTLPMMGRARLITTWIATVLGATGASVRRVEEAQAARCTRASFSEEDFQDTGRDASDATGIASWQPALPFYMQGGFGRK